MLVKFTQAHGAYRGGETAGFSDAEAQRLVDAGVATLVVAEGKAKGAAKAPAEPPSKDSKGSGDGAGDPKDKK